MAYSYAHKHTTLSVYATSAARGNPAGESAVCVAFRIATKTAGIEAIARAVSAAAVCGSVRDRRTFQAPPSLVVHFWGWDVGNACAVGWGKYAPLLVADDP